MLAELDGQSNRRIPRTLTARGMLTPHGTSGSSGEGILPDRRQARRRSSAALGFGEVEQHERPADGPELLVDAGAVAAAPAASVRLRSILALTPLPHAPVEDHLHTLVSGEGALDLLVEL